MTNVAYEPAVTDTNVAGIQQSDEATWRNRIRAAEYHRKPFELGWLTFLAYAAGQQWVTVDRFNRTLRDIRDVDPRYENADLYTADFIKEQRGAALGELQSDTERPEFLAPEDAPEDIVTEGIAAQVNRAISYAWDFEFEGDQQLMDVRRKTIDLGVGAIRCRFDKYAGKLMIASDGSPVQAPLGDDGEPITDASAAHEYVAGKQAKGETAKFSGDLTEGCHRWETGSAFNQLVPPGIPHEKDFPWQIWVRPAPLDEVHEMYPASRDLRADENIGSIMGITVAQGASSVMTAGQPARLADHIWLYTCYERPTKKFPKGRVAVLAGAEKRLLQVIPQLPYQTPDGRWHSGIVYFHWWRLTDRFWSTGLVETLKDSQRMTNRTATQVQEIIDRSMPFGIIEEDSLPQKPSGRPMEWQQVKKGTQVVPQWVAGPGPGLWMESHRQQLMTDAMHASTMSALKLGENPTNVDTYSQLALLQDQEASKRSTIRSDQQQATVKLVEFALLDIAKYWPESKQVLVAGGNENELQAREFSKSIIPPLYIIRAARGSAKPRSQAAQLQLVADIWNAAIASLAVQQDPLAWMQWLKDSYESGEPLALPSPPIDHQVEKARRENHALLNGEVPAVAYWDNIALHLPIHRDAEDQAVVAGDIESLKRIEQHVAEHRQVAAENAQTVAQQSVPPTPSGMAPPPPVGMPTPTGPQPPPGPGPTPPAGQSAV